MTSMLVPCFLAAIAISSVALAQQAPPSGQFLGSGRSAKEGSAEGRGALLGCASGRVSWHDGRPAEGVEIVAIGRSLPGERLWGELDRRSVRADARGSFRLPLRLDRSYSVWAQSDTASGGVHFSAIQDEVGSGVAVALRLEEDPREARQVPIRNQAYWEERLPLRALLLHDCATYFELSLGFEGRRLVLPPSPGARAAFLLFDRAGVLIGLGTVPPGNEPLDTQRNGWDGSLNRGVVRLNEPREYRARVVDDKQKPVAGARLYTCVSPTSSGVP